MKTRQHICDTENPRQPCCWAARNAELKAMADGEKDPKWQAERAEAKAKIDGFITRGVD